jgi:toxin ParE1/3/4
VKAKPVVPRAQALRDVDDAITHYLAEDAEPAALGFIDALEKTYGHLARNPATGSSRYAHELNLPGLRAWPMARYPYVVFSVERSDHIDVWRVLHCQRDIPGWLQEPDGSAPRRG